MAPTCFPKHLECPFYDDPEYQEEYLREPARESTMAKADQIFLREPLLPVIAALISYHLEIEHLELLPRIR
jgi:hypothetical protein